MGLIEVTDKNIRLDKALVHNLDDCVKRQTKNWDNLLIIDGDEGSGKSTLSFQIAYYWAWKTKKKFTVDNVFFDANEVLDFASKTKKQVIVWDEAATSALSTSWQSKIQQKLIINLMMNRKNGHFWIFNIPKVFRLSEYIATERAFFMIHVYSPDYINRGEFTLYNKKKLEYVYMRYKTTKKKEYIKYNFAGSFTNDSVIDNEAYDKKKDEAILKVAGDDSKPQNNDALKDLQYTFATIPNKTVKEIALYADVSTKTIARWRNHGKNRQKEVTDE